ncbi:MAG: hypothetical protein KKA97_02805, partial [Actinobacteria bacterium]|nr:hypothetical protein [Actinomycetota bacterium]
GRALASNGKARCGKRQSCAPYHHDDASGLVQIGGNGRLTLVDPKRDVTKVATLAIVATPTGKPRAAKRGLWLDLAIDPPKGKAFVDGNKLIPLPIG